MNINCRAWFRHIDGEKSVVMITGIIDGYCEVVGHQIFTIVRPDELEAIDTESPVMPVLLTEKELRRHQLP